LSKKEIEKEAKKIKKEKSNTLKRMKKVAVSTPDLVHNNNNNSNSTEENEFEVLKKKSFGFAIKRK